MPSIYKPSFVKLFFAAYMLRGVHIFGQPAGRTDGQETADKNTVPFVSSALKTWLGQTVMTAHVTVFQQNVVNRKNI